MADDNAKELAEREGKAFAAKENLNALHQELAFNFYPALADFTSERTLGEEFSIDLFDSEPLRCCRDLADARSAMMRPTGQDWVRAQTRDEEVNEKPDVARALDAVNKKFRSFLSNPLTGFTKTEKEADPNVVTFGYSVKSAESDIDRYGKRVSVIRCWHLRDCAFHYDFTGMRPEVMFRKFKMSARHIEKRFPKADLHPEIRRAIDKEPDKEFELCHTMMPADEYDWYKKPRRSQSKYQFASIYYDGNHKMLLSESASQRFRYLVERWNTFPGSQYGYSPAAMTGLADARQMQAMMQILVEAGEKSLDPPLKATDGAVKGEIDLGASGITLVDRDYDERLGPAIEPLLPNNRNIPVGIDLINRSILAMRDNWFISKLHLPSQEKTAYETQVLFEQFIRENIPLFSPWEDALSIMLDEVFHVMQEVEREWWGNFLLNAPEELHGYEIEWAFKNQLRDVIERNKVNMAQQTLGIIAGAQQADPQAGANKAVNLIKVVQDAVRGTGAPADWLNDDQDAQDGAAGIAQASQILGALGMADQAANVVKTGSEAAANLQSLNGQSADGSFVRGPV